MKSLRRYLPLLVLLLMLAGSLTSCRDAGVRDALQRAEALMEIDPHAARAVLDSLNPNVDCQTSDSQTADECLGKGSRAKVLSDSLQSVSLKSFSRKDFADWAWLKVQTDYKCDIPLTTDSLARIATEYYGTPRHKNYHSAMAWYTLGCAYKEMDDDVNGTDAFLKAKSLFPDTLIRYYALTETNLGIHHLNRHMDCEAANEFRSAKQNLIRLGDSTAVAFLDLSLARCCLHKENYASAREWLERVLHNPHASRYVFTIAHYEMAKVEIYFTKDYAKAHEYLDYNIQHTVNKKELPGTYCLKAMTFEKQASFDSAWHYHHRSLDCWSNYSTSALNYRQMAILAPQLGKADSIADYVRRYHTYIDSLYIISNQQTIRQVENDHRVEMEQQRLKEQHRRLLFGGIAVLVVLCLSLFTLYLLYRNRNNRKTLALQQAIRQNNVALMNLTVPSEEEKDGTAVSAQTLTNPEAYVRLFRLGRQLLNPEIMEEIKKLNIVSGGEEADRIRMHYADALDQSFVELMMLLRLAVPSLNKRELHYIISRMLGLDDKDIRTIQKTEDSTFRSQKMRFRQKFPAELIERLLLPIEDTKD
ncbi:MAG: hypothetical protein IKH59_07410 [Bacteroidaceae bacterium]|nr:hypothetical protein [Bacteroidaceae bacterium]